jgi:chromosome segregation ATPase
VSKDSVISNYRTQNEELKIQIAEMQTKLDSLPLAVPSEGNCCEDRDKEIQRLRAELTKSKQISQESTRAEQELNELRLSIKMQEAEIRKLLLNNEQMLAQNKILYDKIAQQDKLRSEAELGLHKKQVELESLQKEASRHQFHRDSMESEIRALKDSLQQKDTKLNKKQHKYEALQEQLMDKNSQIASLRHELDVKTSAHKNEILQIQENFAKEVRYKEEIMQNKIAGLEKELHEKHRGGEESGKKLKDLMERVEDRDKEIRRLENDAHGLKSQIDSYKFELSNHEKENKNLKESIDKIQKKRELAKQEVIKLSTKLSSTHKEKPPVSPATHVMESPAFKICFSEAVGSELGVLPKVKTEVDSIYKQLMKVMMNSCSYTNPTQGVSYSISSLEFSQLERRLNNLLMQIHETIENPPPEPVQDTWLNPVTSALNNIKNRKTPIRLFSCMTSQDNNPTTIVRPRTLQGQRLTSNTGGNLPSSAQAEPPSNQRRGSVDHRGNGYKKF